MANKDVRFCPLLSVGIKELYLHATAGLAKPPISLERWLFKYEDKVANGGPGYERPFLISRLAARDYDRPHAATKHGEELNKVAAAEGVSFLGGVFFALRNWRVMQLSADVRTAAEVGAVAWATRKPMSPVTAAAMCRSSRAGHRSHQKGRCARTVRFKGGSPWISSCPSRST